MRPVAMPARLGRSIMGCHVAEADLGQAGIFTKQSFDDREDDRVADRAIDRRTGDQGIAVDDLPREGMPAQRRGHAVMIVEREEFAEIVG